MPFQARPLTTSFLTKSFGISGVLLCILWFASLERYVAARYHLSLDALLNRNQEAAAPVTSAESESDPAALTPLESFNYQLTPPLAPPLPPHWPSLAQQPLRPGAQRILFAGDSMMQGIAPLVMNALKQSHPDWSTYDMSRQNTGLTVKRYFDWPETLVNEMEATKNEAPLTAIVIFLGANDPWDIYEPSLHLKFPSEPWAMRYAQQVDVILRAAKAHGVYVLWLGLPAMKEPRLQTGAALQNSIFYQRAQAFQTDYLSTEPILGYVAAPFARGTLRSGDGIHFSAAGQQALKQAVLDHLEKQQTP